MEIATLNKQKTVVRAGGGNSAIYNVSSRMYDQYVTLKGPDCTRNIVFLLIFFQHNIFRKLRITVISYSCDNVSVR